MILRRPSIGRRIFSSATDNIAIDGNSLVYSVGADDHYVAAQLTLSGPLTGSGITVKSLGLSGQTWQQMTTNHGDVDAAFETGKRNLLFAWEGSNAVFIAGRTGLQSASDAAAYIAAVKATHPEWDVVLVTTIPRRDPSSNGVTVFGSITAANLELVAQDDYIRAHWREMGAVGYVDMRRPGSPWRVPDYSDASFLALNPWTTDSERFGGSGIYAHLTPAGYRLVVDIWQQSLRAMR